MLVQNNVDDSLSFVMQPVGRILPEVDYAPPPPGPGASTMTQAAVLFQGYGPTQLSFQPTRPTATGAANLASRFANEAVEAKWVPMHPFRLASHQPTIGKPNSKVE